MWFHFFFTCYFCTSFNTERIFGFFFGSLPASPSIWNTNVHVVWVTWSAEKSASLWLCVLKLLVWMLAPEKASGVLTHRRESCLPLCLCFWEVPWLWGVRSQLPFVNCLNFFFFITLVLSTWVPGMAWGLNLLIYIKQSFLLLSFCILDVVCSWSRPARHCCLQTGLSDDEHNIHTHRETRSVSLYLWNGCTSKCPWKPVWSCLAGLPVCSPVLCKLVPVEPSLSCFTAIKNRQ